MDTPRVKGLTKGLRRTFCITAPRDGETESAQDAEDRPGEPGVQDYIRIPGVIRTGYQGGGHRMAENLQGVG